MPDRDLPVSLLPRYIWPSEGAAARQRHGAPSNDTEHWQPTAVPKYGSGSTTVYHHCPVHIGEVPGQPTKGYNEIRGGHECEIAAQGDLPVYR